jgi:hypothetical protein
MTAHRILTTAWAIAAAGILAACSGLPSGTGAGRQTDTSPPPSSATPPGASSTAAGPQHPAAHATEANPPGDIPDNQAFVGFSPASGGYSVKIPEGWAQTSSGKTTSFSDKLNHIQVSAATASAQPTVGSVTSTDVPTLRATVPRFAIGKVSEVSRRGGRAILLTYQGDSTPDPVTGKVVRDAFERYTFHLGNRRVDLTLSGPSTADNVDPWRIVSDSLAWTR